MAITSHAVGSPRVGFVVSFAPDFKGTVSGPPIQMLMARHNGVAFLLLTVSYHMAPPRQGLASYTYLGIGGSRLAGTLRALVNVTPFEHYMRIAYTYTLCAVCHRLVRWTSLL